MFDPLRDQAIQSMAEQRIRQYLSEAEIDHRLNEMPPRRSNWWSRQPHQSLHSLGQALTGPAKRLENLDVPITERAQDGCSRLGRS